MADDGGLKIRGGRPAPKRRARGSERRRHHRHDVQGVSGHLHLSFEAKILNLSFDGMALETHGWLSVGRCYSFELRHGQECLELEGTVAWCRLVGTVRIEGESVPVYRAGVHFEDILSEKARQVRIFLEHNAWRRVESTRAFGRFLLRNEGTVGVDFRKEFEVRRLSLSGMLLTSNLVPELQTQFDLELRLDDQVLKAAAQVAHVRRLDEEGGGERAEIGVEFVALGDDERRMLEKLLAKRGKEG